MGDPPYRRFLGIAAISFAAVTIVLLAAIFPAVMIPAGSGPAPTSPYFGLGDGLLTISRAQQVRGAASWESFCATAAPYCIDPVGVTYVSALNAMVVSETRPSLGPTLASVNGVFEFNLDTLRTTAPVLLGCVPGVPLYPGSGDVVFVPCLTATTLANGSIEELNVSTMTVVGSIPIPFAPLSMTYDPTDGMIYAEAGVNGIVTLDPATESVVSVVNLTGEAVFATGLTKESPYDLAYDPITNELLVPAASGGLLAVDPASGVARAVTPSPASPSAIAVSRATDQLIVAGLTIGHGATVEVYSASSYHMESTPVPAGSLDWTPILVLDAVHGDAYLVLPTAVLALNLSTDATIGTIPLGSTIPYPGAPPSGAAYAPGTDRLMEFSAVASVYPGRLVQLHHSSSLTLSRLLWLPTSGGTLVIAALAGAALGGAAYRLGRRTAAGRPRPASRGTGRDRRPRTSL